MNAFLSRLVLSVGIYLAGGRDVTIDDCRFVFGTSGESVFGAGVFAVGTVSQLELDHNQFAAPRLSADLAGGAAADDPPPLLFGYLQVPSRALQPSFTTLAGMAHEGEARAGSTREARTAARARAAATSAAETLMPSLVDATVSRNVFDGVGLPLYVLGRLGPIRIDDNAVRASFGGFWLVDAKNPFVLTLLDRLASAGEHFAKGGVFSLGNPAILLTMVLGRILPLTPDPTDPAGQVGAITAPRKSVLASAEKLLRVLYASSAAATAPAEEEAESGPGGRHDLPGGPRRPVQGAVLGGRRRGRSPPLRHRAPPPGLAQRHRRAFAPHQGPVRPCVARFDDRHRRGQQPRLQRESLLRPRGLRRRRRAPRSRGLHGDRKHSIANEGNDSGFSLILTDRIARELTPVAVTGNVFAGRTSLPPRPLPPPFDTWDPLNTKA